MNVRIFSGYLPADGELAYSPATPERQAQPRLIFDVITRNSCGIEYPEKCVVEDARLIEDYRPLCTKGRVVFVNGEGTARPWHEHGRLKGYLRETLVHKVEFPDRGAKKQLEEATAP